MGVVGVGVVAGLVWMRIEVYMVTMVVFGGMGRGRGVAVLMMPMLLCWILVVGGSLKVLRLEVGCS